MEMYTVDELTVTADTCFHEVDLFDGFYTMVFEMWDASGNFAYSAPIDIEIIDGEMWTNIYDE
jgi:hypothetical protein